MVSAILISPYKKWTSYVTINYFSSSDKMANLEKFSA
jgi:hypothetical protein